MDTVVALHHLCNLALILQVKSAVENVTERRRKRRQMWQRKWLADREIGGGVLNLANNRLRLEDHMNFKNFFRMSSACFDELLLLVEDKIKKTDTNMRRAIPARDRLGLTLRFMATGETFKSLSYATLISHCAISGIINDCLEAIVDCLKEYLQPPRSKQEWETISKEFNEKWNVPNCIGAMDGKHIEFRPSRSDGAFYRNYKGKDSIVLLAVVSASYKFLILDVGKNGRISDGGVFNRSPLSEALKANKLNVPPPKPLPGRDKEVPHVVLADDAFPLRDNILKPFRFNGLSHEQRIYNYRVSRGRRVSENAFGILANRFRVFLSPINLNVHKVCLITKAACTLHNFLLTKSNNYASAEETCECTLNTIIRQGGNRSSGAAMGVRQEYVEYFNSCGRVPWQDKAITMFRG